MATTTGRRWSRLLLVVGTLFGLAVMHTLGHETHAAGHDRAAPAPGHRSGGSAGGHGDGLAGDAPQVRHAAAGAVGHGQGGCPEGCRHERLLAAAGAGGGTSGWSVCLAVLGAFGVSLLLAMLLRAVAREVAPDAGRVGRPAAVSRAPPTRPVGLLLASVSVLRR
ncbi:hypothetical protein [Micromonospora endolithica]|uniref:hypothetical protein n=1 Tax=Micromonospora endolithica TaxID=230091 RepID=UPI001C9B2C1D|nr:hypothetical protein [Micromonospora endolithica]